MKNLVLFAFSVSFLVVAQSEITGPAFGPKIGEVLKGETDVTEMDLTSEDVIWDKVVYQTTPVSKEVYSIVLHYTSDEKEDAEELMESVRAHLKQQFQDTPYVMAEGKSILQVLGEDGGRVVAQFWGNVLSKYKVTLSYRVDNPDLKNKIEQERREQIGEKSDPKPKLGL